LIRFCRRPPRPAHAATRSCSAAIGADPAVAAGLARTTAARPKAPPGRSERIAAFIGQESGSSRTTPRTGGHGRCQRLPADRPNDPGATGKRSSRIRDPGGEEWSCALHGRGAGKPHSIQLARAATHPDVSVVLWRPVAKLRLFISVPWARPSRRALQTGRWRSLGGCDVPATHPAWPGCSSGCRAARQLQRL